MSLPSHADESSACIRRFVLRMHGRGALRANASDHVRQGGPGEATSIRVEPLHAESPAPVVARPAGMASGAALAPVVTRPAGLASGAALAPWLNSKCLELPGFSAHDKYPVRSPLLVADFFMAKVAGKNFCEVGTRHGDIMACLSHFAASVTAIEMSARYCRQLSSRGFRVLCKRFETATSDELAHCDLYFWWPMDAKTQNENWLQLVRNAHSTSGRQAVVYIAHDTHNADDMSLLPKLARAYSGNISRVFFDEGGDLDGSPSYSKPQYGRPGRWGVFHMAAFQVGPDAPPAKALPTNRRHGRLTIMET